MTDQPPTLGQQLAARRKRAPHRCVECGTTFEAVVRKNLTARYCSPRCLMRARRKAAREPS